MMIRFFLKDMKNNNYYKIILIKKKRIDIFDIKHIFIK
jgi:hypothetical protein